jgi:hypothetical protein
MELFSEVKLAWGNKEYTVPADKVLQLIAVIEEHVTMEDLYSTGYKRSKIAAAYTAALRFAGSRALQAQVYSALFDVEDSQRIHKVIDALLHVMIPPAQLQKLMPKVDEGAPKEKKTGTEEL